MGTTFHMEPTAGEGDQCMIGMQRVRGALLRWCWCCCTSTWTRAATANYVDGKGCPRWEEAARVNT